MLTFKYTDGREALVDEVLRKEPFATRIEAEADVDHVLKLVTAGRDPGTVLLTNKQLDVLAIEVGRVSKLRKELVLVDFGPDATGETDARR